MMTLTVGSLFAGIGGLELGLERAGMRVVWQVEKDDYCRRVLAKHWPDVERFEDVKDVGAHNLKPVDLICGGFPCQDISYAGKGAGLSGERSGLWYEFARIIREMEPRIVVVENVAALLARGLDAVLGTLASIGYDAEWDCVSAASVGAPHLRNRVFIVAHSQSRTWRDWGTQEPRERQRKRRQSPRGRRGVEGEVADSTSERCREEGKHQPSRQTQRTGRGSETLAYSKRGGLQSGVLGCAEPTTAIPPTLGGEGRGDSERCAWDVEPNMGRVAYGLPPRLVERSLRALGNAVVPQVAEYIGKLIVEADKELRESA